MTGRGFPCVLLGHRKREFLETTVKSLRTHVMGLGHIVVVDDSGDAEHHKWLDDHGFSFVTVDPFARAGYLRAMNVVWETAQHYVAAGSPHVLLWEEDFVLRKPFAAVDLACLLDHDPYLAQVNLQRQAVYKIERRLGYMQSHQRRGYDLRTRDTEDIAWVQRRRPFTTNPGMIRAEVLTERWPTREEADATAGGAEPAMSIRLERNGWHFGWLGRPNTPYVEHVGTEMKSGKGY